MSDAPSDDDRTVLARCRDRGFTPGARDVEGLVALWDRIRRGEVEGGDARPTKAARVVAKALERGDRGVARALLRGFAEAEGTQRAMRLRISSQIAGRIELAELPELPALLGDALLDPEPRVVREAARVIGKLEGLEELDASSHEPALLSIAEQAQLPEQRAAVEALGRIGGPDALARLQALSPTDADLARRTAQAITLLTRRTNRSRGGAVVLDRPLPRRTPMWLCCRGGAAATVEGQARALLPEASKLRRGGDTWVPLRWSGPLGPLYRVRSATEVALVFPLPPGETLVDRVVAGLTESTLIDAVRAWTEGTPRFRLTLAGGGRRRSEVWTIARRLTEQNSVLVNDTREVSWTVQVDEATGQLRCMPRGADPRFTYRERDVPAATHPTFAALLAWAGGPRAGEVVWDPFCGSGTELVEAARLQDDLHLWGTDISEHAIEGARINLAAAGLDPERVHLQRADALTVTPSVGDRPVSLILSNAPMGRRAAVEEHGMRRLLDDFVGHAARVLGPGGRMVWLTPAPRSTAQAGQRRGFTVEDLEPLDMGGFFATPQVLRKKD